MAFALVAILAAGCGPGDGKEKGPEGPAGGGSAPGPNGGGSGPGSGGAAQGPGQSGTGGASNGGTGAGNEQAPPTGAGSSGPAGILNGGAQQAPNIFSPGGGGAGFTPNLLDADCAGIIQYTGETNCAVAPDAESYLAPNCVGETCLRDTYVAAAILYCWAAYCTTTGQYVGPYQQCAREQLCNANNLCSNAPSVCEDPCSTNDIWFCDTTTGIGESPLGGCPQTCPLTAATSMALDAPVRRGLGTCADRRNLPSRMQLIRAR